MAKKAEELKAEVEESAAVQTRSAEASFLAFATYEGPNGETWHVTIREGMTIDQAGGLFGVIAAVGEAAVGAGFIPLSEANEFKMTIPAHRVAEMREQRRLKAEQDRERREAGAARQRPHTSSSPEPTRRPAPTPPPPQAPPTGPQSSQSGPTNGRGGQPPSSGGQTLRAGWDLSKSPVAVGKLKIQGTTQDPEVHMFCSNGKLKFPVWKIKAGVLSAIISSHYAIDQSDMKAYLTTVGKEIKVEWLVHWTPSPKNNAWKDILDVEIPDKSMLRRQGLAIGKAAA